MKINKLLLLLILFLQAFTVCGAIGFTNDNTVPTYHYYTQDHLGNNRAVVNDNGTVEQITHYYPFGGTYADVGLNSSLQPYKYNGKELDRMHGLNLYDYGARHYDAIVPMFTQIDPLAEKYYNFSPYVYCENNPIKYVDPDGTSTWVKYEKDGTYSVFGGDLDDEDLNIYVYNKDDRGQYTLRGKSIGVTAVPTSFYDSDIKTWRGTINSNDNSGIQFLNEMQGDDGPSLFEYMYNARTGKKYDFKVTNGSKSIVEGIDIYRGMPISTNPNNVVTYASARDVGNIAAGYIAAKMVYPGKLQDMHLIFIKVVQKDLLQ